MAGDRRPGGRARRLPPGGWSQRRPAPGPPSQAGPGGASADLNRRRRFKLTLEYAGTRYSGWQVQQNARTIQGELERAITEATGAPPLEIYGSGRTDAGVHALAQVAHADLITTLPTDTLCRRINDALPNDIVLLRVEPVHGRFHARHDAEARVYLYQIARRRTAFAKTGVWWVKEALDVPRMRAAAACLVGFHDFQAFTDDDRAQKSTQVKLDRLDLVESGDLLLVHVEGSHFLWKMVRRLVGVLVEAGRGGLSVADVDALLRPEARTDTAARLTAPASGLFLARVYYPGDARTPVHPIINLPR